MRKRRQNRDHSFSPKIIIARLWQIKLRRAEIRLALDQLKLASAQAAMARTREDNAREQAIAAQKAALAASPAGQARARLQERLRANSQYYLDILNYAQDSEERAAYGRAKAAADLAAIATSNNPIWKASQIELGRSLVPGFQGPNGEREPQARQSHDQDVTILQPRRGAALGADESSFHGHDLPW